MPVALFEFDNTIADTFGTLKKINKHRINPISVGAMDQWCMSRLKINAYMLVMIHMLRQRGYTIDIYSRRSNSDPDGELVKKWLNDKEVDYDKLHVLDKKEKLITIVRGYTYLITTNVDDALLLNNFSMLSSATIVDTVINKNIKLPIFCYRLYL